MANTIYIRKFCGVDLDIRDFQKIFPYNVEGVQNHSFYSAFDTPSIQAEFLGFEWEFIGDEPDDSDAFNNKSIKALGSVMADVDSIAYDFRTSGYDISKFPGIKSQEGTWKNGRTRNRAARKNNQDWIPIARFNFTVKNEKLANLSTSSKANSKQFHKTQHDQNLSDYEEQGVSAVQLGIPRTESDIRKWFLTETNFHLDYDVDKNLTGVVNKVIARTAFEMSLVNHDIDHEDFVSKFKVGNTNPKVELPDLNFFILKC